MYFILKMDEKFDKLLNWEVWMNLFVGEQPFSSPTCSLEIVNPGPDVCATSVCVWQPTGDG